MTYPITFWYGIPRDFLNNQTEIEQRVSEAAAAGMTVMECRYDKETNQQFLKVCETYQVRANLYDERIGDAYRGAEGWEKGLAEMMEDYRDYPALLYYFVKDEPVDTDFPALSRVVDFLRERDPSHPAYINLLPNKALGTNEAYMRHVNAYLDAVRPEILSYDHYNLMKREVERLDDLPEAPVSNACRKANGWETAIFEQYDREGFYDNLEIIRSEARKRNIPWMTILLLVEHWHYRLPEEGELRWEVFQALAYGSKMISYFTYWTPDRKYNQEPWTYHNAIINADGTRNEKYDIVKRINADLAKLGNYIHSAESMEVFHVGSEPGELLIRPFHGYGRVTKVEANGITLGFFDNNSFLAANKNKKEVQRIAISFDGSGLEHFDKENNRWEPCVCKNGISQATLAPGDGELFRYAP